MKKYFTWLSLFFATMLILPTVASCRADDDRWYEEPQEKTPYLNSSSSISCSSKGAYYKIPIVNYKPGVSVFSTASWCSVLNDSYNAFITVNSNSNSSSRNCYVELKYQGSTVSSIFISQEGSSNSGGNTGGGNNGGNTGGGSTGGGSTTTKPSPPTGVYAYSSGNAAYPQVSIEWNSVNGATSYEVYRSTSSYGSYSKITTCSYPSASDSNVKIGGTYYYKVKAKNSAGSSDYSDYTAVTLSDTRTPGPVTYTSRTVSGTTITLKWTIPTHSTYGKPDKIVLRLHDPVYGWIDAQELSGTATSVSFGYIPWVDSDGYVKCGVIPYNSNGSGGGQAQVYDTKSKKWIN